VGGQWLKESATKVTSPSFVHKGALVLDDSTQFVNSWLVASFEARGPGAYNVACSVADKVLLLCVA